MRRAWLVVATWVLVGLGCSKGLGAPAGDAPASAGPAAPSPPVFIENDYKRARAEALRRGVPLVVFG